MPDVAHDQDRFFEEVMSSYSGALERLARAYEADPEVLRDLLQEIYIALWRSLAAFDNRCSLRTWVYRVAHNVAASHVDKQVRARKLVLVSLDELEDRVDAKAGEAYAERRQALGWLYAMIHELKPLDRQVMLAYLEGLDAASTAEITGLSAGHVATKIHRIKQAFGERFRKEAAVNNESPEDRNVMELWQNQKTEGVRVSVEQIRSEAGRFERRINRRNVREYVAGLSVIVFYGYMFARISGLWMHVGFGLNIVGMSYVMWHLLTKGSPGAMGEDAGRANWIEFRRAELVRQRDLLRNVWRWYLGPLLPGVLMVIVAAECAAHAAGHALVVWTAEELFVIALFLATAQLNKRGARKLQRQIDELDEQSRG